VSSVDRGTGEQWSRGTHSAGKKEDSRGFEREKGKPRGEFDSTQEIPPARFQSEDSWNQSESRQLQLPKLPSIRLVALAARFPIREISDPLFFIILVSPPPPPCAACQYLTLFGKVLWYYCGALSAPAFTGKLRVPYPSKVPLKVKDNAQSTP